MADHPLRPATDRRLGRPLPHQQPNRTQAAPKAHHCFEPQLICGISPSFPGLSPTSGHVPTRYAPVRRCRCRPRDLHVLSMPPAFALSQDQTLRFIHQPSLNPASSEPPCTHLSQQLSQPSHKTSQDQPTTPKTPAAHHHQHPSADRASHPRPAPPPQQASQPTRQQHQPSAQHTAITGQPKPPIRTAKIKSNFRNQILLSKNNTNPARATSGEATSHQIGESRVSRGP